MNFYLSILRKRNPFKLAQGKQGREGVTARIQERHSLSIQRQQLNTVGPPWKLLIQKPSLLFVSQGLISISDYMLCLPFSQVSVCSFVHFTHSHNGDSGLSLQSFWLGPLSQNPFYVPQFKFAEEASVQLLVKLWVHQSWEARNHSQIAGRWGPMGHNPATCEEYGLLSGHTCRMLNPGENPLGNPDISRGLGMGYSGAAWSPPTLISSLHFREPKATFSRLPWREISGYKLVSTKLEEVSWEFRWARYGGLLPALVLPLQTQTSGKHWDLL